MSSCVEQVDRDAIDPVGWYECVIHPRGDEPQSYEIVRGEDILAAADYLDQLMSQREDDK